VASERITFDPDKIGRRPSIRGPGTGGEGVQCLELTAEAAGPGAEKKANTRANDSVSGCPGRSGCDSAV
jgi:hypothetical protein